MQTLALAPAAQGLFGAPDWASLGLVSAIVGCFLIANAILFEHPRLLVQRYFGRRTGRLRSVREYIYNRVQTTLGFTFLLTGFGLQLVGRYGEVSAAGRVPLPMVWVGVIVIVAVGLLLGGWWWSLLAFRRYVREYFLENASDLEGDPATAKELGELFGVERFEEDTVDDYVRRLRSKAGLASAHRPRLARVEPASDADVGEEAI
ncbi:MAG: hypothetical protein ACI8QZ_004312 [Chlamydiales bacterium]|jgi:hypothetical protein